MMQNGTTPESREDQRESERSTCTSTMAHQTNRFAHPSHGTPYGEGDRWQENA